MRDNIFKSLLKVFSYNFFSKVNITKMSLNNFVNIYLINHLDNVLGSVLRGMHLRDISINHLDIYLTKLANRFYLQYVTHITYKPLHLQVKK